MSFLHLEHDVHNGVCVAQLLSAVTNSTGLFSLNRVKVRVFEIQVRGLETPERCAQRLLRRVF